MGGKQTKGRGAAGPAHAADLRMKPPDPGGGDLPPTVGLKAEERRSRSGPPAPYQRRVGLIQDLVSLAKQGRQQEAAQLLRSLRQDLGMESTSLDSVLCRYASFRNLVDPITHELIISLARYIHCPKPSEGCPVWEPAEHDCGLVRNCADPARPASCHPVPAALLGDGVHRGVRFHRADGRGLPAAFAHLGLAAQPLHPVPQRQQADPGHPAPADRRPQGPRQVPQHQLDRPWQQRGHLLAASALPGWPAEALPQAREPAHHLGIRGEPGRRAGGRGDGDSPGASTGHGCRRRRKLRGRGGRGGGRPLGGTHVTCAGLWWNVGHWVLEALALWAVLFSDQTCFGCGQPSLLIHSGPRWPQCLP
ncbi:uncharacterized protein [Mobula birostris]|uniref:uncharacterized protein isoform X1 n=1 Tax=Mobula birostris TaxID=1983395 RepID=UPI003B289B18